jgi:sugar phosphate isomerase/epimerase
MRLGIFAKTFPGSDPETVLAGVANAGFGLAQYNLACSGLDPLPGAIPEEVTTAIRAASAAAGVGIAAVSGTVNMIHPDPEVRRDGLRRLAVLITAAPAMGTRLVTLCTGTRDPADPWKFHPDNATPEAWRDLVASMETAIAAADANGVDLGIEPELANVVSSAEAARRLIDEMQSPRLRIVLDAANLFETASLAEQRDIVARAVDLLADRIVMAHAKDRAVNGDFVAAGQGVLDYRHYLAALRRAGFDGALVAHGLTAGEAPAVGAFLRRALSASGAMA